MSQAKRFGPPAFAARAFAAKRFGPPSSGGGGFDGPTLATFDLNIPTNAGRWTALLGSLGSARLDVVITDASVGAPPSNVEVREDERYDLSTDTWIAAASTIGVCIFNGALDVTTTLLESILDSSLLCVVIEPDPNPEDFAYLGDPFRWNGEFA